MKQISLWNVYLVKSRNKNGKCYFCFQPDIQIDNSGSKERLVGFTENGDEGDTIVKLKDGKYLAFNPGIWYGYLWHKKAQGMLIWNKNTKVLSMLEKFQKNFFFISKSLYWAN